MHGAGAALRDAAAELGPGQAEGVAQHPQQRRVGLDLELVPGAVHFELDRHAVLRLRERCPRRPRRHSRAAPAHAYRLKLTMRRRPPRVQARPYRKARFARRGAPGTVATGGVGRQRRDRHGQAGAGPGRVRRPRQHGLADGASPAPGRRRPGAVRRQGRAGGALRRAARRPGRSRPRRARPRQRGRDHHAAGRRGRARGGARGAGGAGPDRGLARRRHPGRHELVRSRRLSRDRGGARRARRAAGGRAGLGRGDRRRSRHAHHHGRRRGRARSTGQRRCSA